MLDCSEFLEGYSAYRDGELDDHEHARFDAHRAQCCSCERYDRLISRGVEQYRRCPTPELSEDFQLRLQHRILHLEDEMRARPRNGSGAQAAVTFALAATIAAIAWIPVTRVQPSAVELPAIAARAPLPAAPAPATTRFETAPTTAGGGATAADLWTGWGAFGADNPLGSRAAFGGSEFRVRQVLQH